ncbi:hypothetical protein ACLQ9F_17060 [Bordetella avium]|uniref:hypothetical protein n=1 Tax=Bordetella avium TaxID=521 RepID=UPI000E0B5D6D|nr:hypothetical protein [Bordetella avium]RIQ11213.1 hypothetical protein D0432_17070 [Bordetella avium]RIQ17434.1 hypothetical protein D0850_11260 [Bordetella avium]RIQ42345.1 hypothetical protein D0847_10555 [Bordetella avium]RIQ42795.1 hypothetical protein D0846_12055 [Bordetella avium]RIQ48465.1 hypothetical protein D0844_17115 [Bordetella avium]
MDIRLDHLLAKLTASKPAVDDARATIRAIGEDLIAKQRALESKKQEIQKDIKRGSRLTKHRFSL